MGIKFIDWSAKHDVLIDNGDGTFSPMDEPYFRSEKVAPGTWKVLSSGDYSYLLEGDKKAIAVDTGYGAGNIREYMQGLTEAPLEDVVNTHDHFDHTANNAYFEHAYMSEKTAPLATIPFASFAGVVFPNEYDRIIVHEGDRIDLGGRDLEVFEIPDHAPGSIVLLDRKERLLFSGDEFMMRGKILKVGLTTYMGYLKKLSAVRDSFDRLCAGAGVLDADLFDRQLECASHILKGHQGKPVTTPPKPKFPERRDENGRLIYGRTAPHPGDGGSEHEGENISDILMMEYADTVIYYDPARIEE